MDIKLDTAKKQIIITLPYTEDGTPSASGKTMVHATTHGNKPAPTQINGHDIFVGANVYSYPEE